MIRDLPASLHVGDTLWFLDHEAGPTAVIVVDLDQRTGTMFVDLGGRVFGPVGWNAFYFTREEEAVRAWLAWSAWRGVTRRDLARRAAWDLAKRRRSGLPPHCGHGHHVRRYRGWLWVSPSPFCPQADG